MTTLMVVLGLAIAAVVVVRTVQVMRDEAGLKPGAEPGKGHHVLRGEYSSGGGGGGHSNEYTVPRDPQDYARLFVPKDKGASQ